MGQCGRELCALFFGSGLMTVLCLLTLPVARAQNRADQYLQKGMVLMADHWKHHLCEFLLPTVQTLLAHGLEDS
jgi:hypothetical protein